MARPSILDTIRLLAEQNRIRLTRHARARMWERWISEEDVRHSLMRATSAVAQETGTWRTSGIDTDGDDLTVVVVVEEDVVIVTVF